MIKIKCDFCGKEILFENIQDVLNDNIRKDIKYYNVCQDCSEKIRNLIIGDKFGVITFMEHRTDCVPYANYLSKED